LEKQHTQPKITIGMPVYNGADSVKKALNSLLSQTYRNYKLIISDNGSTDSTSEICLEYKDKDERIEYIRQKKTVDIVENWLFVLDKADTEYFMWAPADDIWKLEFIEKNLEILESHNEVVGSTSDFEVIDNNIKNYSNSKKSDLKNSRLKFVHTIQGTYEEKINFIMKSDYAGNIYSIFRTNELKKSIIRKKFPSYDFALMLSIIKFGDLHVIDDVLLQRGTNGISSTKSTIEMFKKWNLGWKITYFPYIPYTLWFIQNLGLKKFVKYFYHFKYLNIHEEKKIFLELIQKNKFFNNYFKK
jgi:glycosyltransferase involved in cell wall biosynthesis